MGYFRPKRNFTAGELSPLLGERTDNDRHKNGCNSLYNMYVKPQGAAVRRPGFKFIADIGALIGGTRVGKSPARIVPFVFDEDTAYILVFYPHQSGTTRVVFAINDGVTDGLIEDPASPGNPYVLEITGTFVLANFRYSQTNDVLYLVQTGREPLELIRLADDNWTISSASFTAQPTDWSTPNGWPELVNLFEQRAVYAANKTRPQTLWFTQSGDFYDFTVNSPVKESDGVTFTLDSGKQNKLRWLSSSTLLLMGTLGGEWTIGGPNGAPLSFSSVKATKHTNRGGEPNTPIQIGNITLFVERLGRTINMYVFDFNVDGFIVTDLSVLAPHLTETNKITDWCYQQTPNGIVWCARDDGILVALTFQREHNVIGWHRHETDGNFLAVGCIPGTSESELWSVVERTINGTVEWYLERMETEFLSGAIGTSRFVDSHLVYSGAPASVITGLDHLEGKEIHILSDGVVHAPRTVASGQITLDNQYSSVVVGLPFDSDVSPVLTDIELNDGTTHGRMQRIVKAHISLFNSLGMYIERINDDGESIEDEIPFRLPTDLTGQAVAPFTGYKTIDFPEGHGRDIRVFIRQKQPLPLTVLGVIDEVQVNR